MNTIKFEQMKHDLMKAGFTSLQADGYIKGFIDTLTPHEFGRENCKTICSFMSKDEYYDIRDKRRWMFYSTLIEHKKCLDKSNPKHKYLFEILDEDSEYYQENYYTHV